MHLTELVRDAHAAPEFAMSLTGSGGWAQVSSIATGQVTVTFDDFDAGTRAFGPVPVADLAGDGIVVGDRVWLLVDSAGEPGAALKF